MNSLEKAYEALPFLRDQFPQACLKKACGIKLDIGRQRLSADDYEELVKLGAKARLIERFRSMMAGEVVNDSEGRAALHTSLRAFSRSAPEFDCVEAERERMFAFARDVREGRRRGCRGSRFTDVINVGIGGSEMGPHAAYHALRTANPDIRLHFLSSVDGVLLERTLAQCDAQRTLIVVSSKSFRTRETQVNASAVDQWLLDNGIVGEDRARHIVLVSANERASAQMCLPDENLFRIWDWVGGRFSVWGSVGLPVAIAIGPESFREFLQGAEEMDRHTASAELRDNLPAHLALCSWFNAVKLGVATHCLLPYDERLRLLVPWAQQLEMESLGKTVALDGTRVETPTGQGIWGGNGNEAQHSFYQWLREGTASCSIDLLWSEMPGHRYAEHYKVLLANARAQAEALVMRTYPGPYFNAVNTLALDAVTPRRLGALMAAYEHKTTMLGVLFNVNPFDQPGVELGKRLSHKVEEGCDVATLCRNVLGELC